MLRFARGVCAMFLLLPALPVMAQSQSRSLESDVLSELNWVRAHPREYADELRQYRQQFDGRVVYQDGNPVGTITQEGMRAVDEAIAFLDRQQPLPPLEWGDILTEAAVDHVADQGRNGGFGHRSSNGGTVGDRVKAHGGGVFVAETISYGMNTPRTVVRQLIVDDGVPSRGHRTLLFSGQYQYAGVGCGYHVTYHEMCVIDLSATANGTPPLPGGGRPVIALAAPAR